MLPLLQFINQHNHVAVLLDTIDETRLTADRLVLVMSTVRGALEALYSHAIHMLFPEYCRLLACFNSPHPATITTNYTDPCQSDWVSP
jgi:hypothetical protein